jgi:hypothetical protein
MQHIDGDVHRSGATDHPHHGDPHADSIALRRRLRPHALVRVSGQQPAPPVCHPAAVCRGQMTTPVCGMMVSCARALLKANRAHSPGQSGLSSPAPLAR